MMSSVKNGNHSQGHTNEAYMMSQQGISNSRNTTSSTKKGLSTRKTWLYDAMWGIFAPTKMGEKPIQIHDIIFQVISLILAIADLSSNIWVAIDHQRDGDIWWMTLSITFIFTPYLFIIIVPIYMVIIGETDWTLLKYAIPGSIFYWHLKAIRATIKAVEVEWMKPTDGWGFKSCIYILGKLFKTLLRLDKGYKDEEARWIEMERRKENMAEYANAMGDASTSSLVEIYVQDAPQLTLQLYIILDDPQMTVSPAQWFSIFVSLISIAWGISSASKGQYMTRRKVTISYPAFAMCFGWHLFTVWARALGLAICSIYLIYALIGIICARFFVSCLFLISVYHKFLGNSDLYVMGFLMSIMSCISSYVPGHAPYSRLQYLILHILIYIENVCMLILWYFSSISDDAPLWLKYLASVSIIGGYLIGVLCQIFYYVDLHPRNFQEEDTMQIQIFMGNWKIFVMDEKRRKIEEKVVKEWKKTIEKLQNEEESKPDTETARQMEFTHADKEIARQMEYMPAFIHCRDKFIGEWQDVVLKRWTKNIIKWTSKQSQEDVKKKQEERIERQIRLMTGFDQCTNDVLEQFQKEIMKRWTKEIRRWTEDKETEKTMENEIVRQMTLMTYFDQCEDEELGEWQNLVIRRWTEKIRGWTEEPMEIKKQEEEIERQVGLMTGFYYCCEEVSGKEGKWVLTQLAQPFRKCAGQEKPEVEKPRQLRSKADFISSSDYVIAEWKKEVLKKWTKKIRSWKSGETRNDEDKRQKDGIKRQVELMSGFFGRLAELGQNVKDGILTRWTQGYRILKENGNKLNGSISQEERELRRYVRSVTGFVHCSKEIRSEWENEVLRRWTEKIRGWTEGEPNEIVKQEEEIDRQVGLMTGFVDCSAEVRKKWEKTVSKIWGKKLLHKRTGEKINKIDQKEISRHESEIKKQLHSMTGFIDCSEEVKGEWQKVVLRRWTEQIRRWTEGQPTELKRKEEEINRQMKFLTDFDKCESEVRDKWQEEVLRWWSENGIKRQEEKINRLEEIMRYLDAAAKDSAV